MDLYHCRAGFESDCAAELTAAALDAGVEGRSEYERNRAFVLWRPAVRQLHSRRDRLPPLAELVFARQKIERLIRIDDLRAAERLAAIVDRVRSLGWHFSTLWLEAPDSESGRKLLGSVRGIHEPLQTALHAAGMLQANAREARLHLCFVDRESAYIGTSNPRDSSPWPMGIPRLRFPAGAPSRSGLKLVEALATFIGEDELLSRLRAGRVAIDLGAAPGGWSHVLASRGLRVLAVDNGPLAPAVLATQMVEHRREDAFRFRPERPVDWMVCDVIAAPARIAALAAQWIARGWCRETIFNLKLPSANRWQEVLRCRGVIERALAHVDGRHELRIKHLYHDREEVSAHLRRL